MLSPEAVKGIQWKPWYSRDVSLQTILAFSISTGEPLRRLWGFEISDILHVYDGRQATGFSPESSISGINGRVRTQFLEADFQENFFKIAGGAFDNVLSTASSFDSANLARMPDKELASLYRTFARLRIDSIAAFWYGFFAQPEVADKAKCILDSAGKPELLDAVLTPPKPSYAAREKIELLELSVKRQAGVLNSTALDSLLAEHARKWAFIPMYDFYYPPYSTGDFASRLAGVENPESQLAAIADAERENDGQTAEAFSLPSLSAADLRFLKFAKNFASFKEYRNEVRARTSYHGRVLFDEISRRLGITLKEVLFLTNEEIPSFLESGSKPEHSEISARMASYVLIQSGGEIAVFVGPEAKKFFSILMPEEAPNGFTGVCASRGKATGFAKIVNNAYDLAKLEDGDVLVSSMTRPEYVVGMKKACAIVTDEGGLLSHAAIVSRELGIPCVVGTKFASRALKDGDLVEVDATNAVVKKLDRGK